MKRGFDKFYEEKHHPWLFPLTRRPPSGLDESAPQKKTLNSHLILDAGPILLHIGVKRLSARFAHWRFLCCLTENICLMLLVIAYLRFFKG